MNPAEQYIVNQPEPYRSILLYLQAVIEKTVPEVELKYKYQIPFYYIFGKPFCYFNASHKKQYVDVGFWQGQNINIHQEYLVKENRKMIVSLRYKSLEDINKEVLVDVLLFAKNLY